MECELLIRKIKKTNPEEWAKSVQVHTELSKATRAVKILNDDDAFLSHLRTAMDQDTFVCCKFVNIVCARASKIRVTLCMYNATK